ncbi:MAG: Uma2 family endonuclease [Candidatus Tectomicrobia bacterium]|nr:Uma2 family endonuclease [Candidatus Tectomicrobia bacterium]
MMTKTKALTYKEYLALPETMQRYEIIDGELIMPPAPTPDHQWILRTLVLHLQTFVAESRLGEILFAPLDILISRDPLRTRQPDLAYFSAERSGIRGRESIKGRQLIDQVPDLVVEILSLSNTRSDIARKLDDYRMIGVRECWLISPEAETVEVLRLSPERIKRIALVGIGETIRSEVLPGLNLSVDQIFE